MVWELSEYVSKILLLVQLFHSCRCLGEGFVLMGSREQDQNPGLSAPISFGMRPLRVCSWGSTFTTGVFCSGTEFCHCPTA